MKKHLQQILTLYVISLSGNQVMADNWFSPIREEMSGVWGIGGTIKQSNYTDSSTDLGIAPFIFGSIGPVTIEANRASYSLYRDGTWFASFVGQVRTHQYREATQTSEEKKRAVELGAQVGRRLGAGFTTRLALLQDVSSVHNSHEWDWQLYRRDFFGNLSILTSIGLQYQSKGLVDYYYGTPTYQPEASFVKEFETIFTYFYGDNWAAFVGARYYHFSDEVNNSPEVTRDYILNAFMGIGLSL